MKLVRFLVTALSVSGLVFTGCKKDTYTPPPAIVVNAGAAQSVQLPQDSVVLTATIISGQSPTLVYAWTLIVGPNTPTISNSSSLIATAKGLIAGTYIFQFAATNNSGTVIGEDTVSVFVVSPTIKTLTLQPNENPYEGNINAFNPNSWFGSSGDGMQMLVTAWTSGGAPYTARTCVKFDFSSIPQNATINSATLYLYSAPNPLNGNLVDAQYGTSDACYIQRITSNWTLPTPFTWNNPPTSTTTNEAVIPQSVTTTDNAVVDVTALVNDMQADGNNGFYLRLQNEVIYNVRQYASSYGTDAATRPKLVITYQ